MLSYQISKVVIMDSGSRSGISQVEGEFLRMLSLS